MAYKSPTLSQLIARNVADIETQTGQKTIVTEGVAFANAANAYGLHEHINYLQRQIVPHLADEEWLLKHCEFWGVTRKDARRAEGEIQLSVIANTSISAGIQFKRSDGALFEAQSTSSLHNGAQNIRVIAVNAGATGNTKAGEKLTLLTPVLGVENDAVVVTSITGGANAETIDSLVSRLMFRVQYPPSGGNQFDYIRWARECAGVTRAWCISAPFGTNLITVIVAMDEQHSVSSDDTARVHAYITSHKNPVTNQWGGKPLGVELVVNAVGYTVINPVIKLYPDSNEVRAAVIENLTHYISSLALGEAARLSKMRGAISSAEGVIDYVMSKPIDNVIPPSNHVIKLGAVEWQ